MGPRVPPRVLASLPVRASARGRLPGRLSLALALLALVVLGGTLGYILLERWSAFDALYMTVTTITTVGYREVRPLSFGGRAFTLILIVVGVGTALYTFATITELVVEGALFERLGRRRMERELKAVRDHYILCGYGRIGGIVAEEFRRRPVPFVVIDQAPARLADSEAAGNITWRGTPRERRCCTGRASSARAA